MPGSDRVFRAAQSSAPRSPRPEGRRTPISRIERLIPLQFSLSSDVVPARQDVAVGSQIQSAEGVAWRADGSCLCFEVAHRHVVLHHNLPSAISLRALLGQAVRVTLIDETVPGVGIAGQTLTLSGGQGQVWLIARLGLVRGVVHAFGGTEIHAALSQRADGPLVVGTRELQGLVYPGGHLRLPGSRGSVIVELLARISSDTAAYVLADESIYTGAHGRGPHGNA